MNVYQVVVLTLLISIVGGAVYFATSSGTTKTAYSLLADSSNTSPLDNDSEQGSGSSTEKHFLDGVLGMFSSKKKAHPQVNSLVAQFVQGTYMCTKSDTSDGCTADMKLVLEGDGRADLISSYDDGAEVKHEEGVWEVNDVGQIMVTLNYNQSSNYRQPHLIMFNREEDGSTLVAAQYNQEHYPGILTGLFVRQ
jgi:hypothetical protein